MDSQVTVLATLYAKIPTEKIAFLKFILEGYDGLAIMSTVDRDAGLAIMSTVDRDAGLVSLRYFPACREDLVALLDSLLPAIGQQIDL